MIKEALKDVVEGKDLSYDTAKEVMNEIMSGEASQMLVAAYLTALRMKGETIDEITASAEGMRSHATPFPYEGDLLEIVGTGGDEANSFNISTTSAIVVSAAGIPVAKHGNRSVSSKSGAADVLEAAGVDITISPEKSADILKKIGISFMFAQIYHPAMKNVGPVRKELGLRTIFNILGPLTNPAHADYQLLGVYDESLVRPLAEVLVKLGVKRGMVVYGQDRLDEISMSSDTTCAEINDGSITEYVIKPEDYGFTKCSKDALVGGAGAENAKILRAILDGSEKGAKRDAVVINSAAALHIVKGISMEDAIKEVNEVIDNGKALSQLDKFIEMTNA